MKQKTQAFRHVRMPSKSTSVNSMPQSSPGSRTSSQEAVVPSVGSKTSRSHQPPSASQRQSLTVTIRMPGSMPASQAGLPSSTRATQAPSAWGRVEA